MRMSATSRVLAGLVAGVVTRLLLAAWQPRVALQVAGVAQPIGKVAGFASADAARRQPAEPLGKDED